MDYKMELSPWFPNSPINKALYGWNSLQHTHCADFELDFYRCSYRVGKRKAREFCSKEMEDVIECITHTKSMRRSLMMRKERQLQGKPYESQPAAHLHPSFLASFDIFRLLPKRKERKEE